MWPTCWSLPIKAYMGTEGSFFCFVQDWFNLTELVHSTARTPSFSPELPSFDFPPSGMQLVDARLCLLYQCFTKLPSVKTLVYIEVLLSVVLDLGP